MNGMGARRSSWRGSCPLFCTFAPFVAGMGRMTYRTLHGGSFNVVGGIAWIFGYSLCWQAGDLRTMPWVQTNFKRVILGIIVVSILPAVFEIVRERRRSRKPAV